MIYVHITNNYKCREKEVWWDVSGMKEKKEVGPGGVTVEV